MAKQNANKKDRSKQNANLKPPYKKGQSGNPAGKPKGTEHSATRLLRFLHAIQTKKNPMSGADEKMTLLEQLDLAMMAKALKGDVRAYEQIIDRLEGKAVQKNINIAKVGVEAEKEEYI